MHDEFIILDDGDMVNPMSIREVLGEYRYLKYNGEAVKKIKITSTRPMYICTRSGEVVKQALTIRADGRVALTTFDAIGMKFRAMDSRNYDYDNGETDRVINAIRTFFQKDHDKEEEMDAGEWEIIITDESGNRFKESGTLAGESEFRILSDNIRKVLKLDLILFDGQC